MIDETNDYFPVGRPRDDRNLCLESVRMIFSGNRLLIAAIRIRDDQIILSGGRIRLRVSKSLSIGCKGDITGTNVWNSFADSAERGNAIKFQIALSVYKKTVENMRAVRRKSQFINLSFDGRQKTDLACRADLLHPQTIAFALAQNVCDVFSVRRNGNARYLTAVR